MPLLKAVMIGWKLGKGFSPRVWLDTGTGSPGECSQLQPDGVQEAFGQRSHAYAETLGASCAGPGVGLKDSDGSLPTQGVL